MKIILIINIFIILLIVSIEGYTKGINFPDNSFISINTTYGFMPDPNYSYQHLLNGYMKSANLTAGLNLKGSQYWHKYYNYPETGLSFVYYNLSNNEQLGSVFGLIPYIEIRLYNSQKLYPSFNMGIGLSYISKKYDKLNNHQNVLIGSHLNAAIRTGFDLHFQLKQNFFIYTGSSFIHCSNGNIKYPNKGLNIITGNAGIKYYFNKTGYDTTTKTNSFKKYQFTISYAISFTNIKTGINNGFNYHDFMIDIHRKINPIYYLGLGIDYAYNNADTNIVYFENKFIPSRNNISGIKISNNFKFSRFEVLLQLGMHLFNSNKIYDWIILRYRIYQNVKVNLSYKSYFNIGDHLGWGISYTF